MALTPARQDVLDQLLKGETLYLENQKVEFSLYQMTLKFRNEILF